MRNTHSPAHNMQRLFRILFGPKRLFQGKLVCFQKFTSCEDNNCRWLITKRSTGTDTGREVCQKQRLWTILFCFYLLLSHQKSWLPKNLCSTITIHFSPEGCKGFFFKKKIGPFKIDGNIPEMFFSHLLPKCSCVWGTTWVLGTECRKATHQRERQKNTSQGPKHLCPEVTANCYMGLRIQDLMERRQVSGPHEVIKENLNTCRKFWLNIYCWKKNQNTTQWVPRGSQSRWQGILTIKLH